MRSRRFLNPSSYTKVNTECQKRLVEDYLGFLHSECKELIKNEVKPGIYFLSKINFFKYHFKCLFSRIYIDLRNMYKLLKPFPNGLTVMVEEVQNHIARIGLEAVNSLKGDNVMQFLIM